MTGGNISGLSESAGTPEQLAAKLPQATNVRNLHNVGRLSPILQVCVRIVFESSEHHWTFSFTICWGRGGRYFESQQTGACYYAGDQSDGTATLTYVLLKNVMATKPVHILPTLHAMHARKGYESRHQSLLKGNAATLNDQLRELQREADRNTAGATALRVP